MADGQKILLAISISLGEGSIFMNRKWGRRRREGIQNGVQNFLIHTSIYSEVTEYYLNQNDMGLYFQKN